jgi:hypothetical protein
MLCEGHTPVTTGQFEYSYEAGEKEETIEFSYKDMVKELEMHLSARLNAANISLDDVDFTRADFITGADHGKGAFQVGVKVVLPFEHKAMKPVRTEGPDDGYSSDDDIADDA